MRALFLLPWGFFLLGLLPLAVADPVGTAGWGGLLASLALLYGTVFLSTTASALAAVATLLLMRLLVAFPALTPFLLTTYLDLYLRPEAVGLGLPLLLLYTLGFALLAALVFEQKDL